MNVTAKRCGACRRVLLNERRDYCDDDCKRDAAYTRERFAKGTKTVRVCVLLAPGYETGVFLQVNQQPPNHPPPPDGAFVRGQIEAQRDQPYPVSFTAPDGTKCRMWLPQARAGEHNIGADRAG